MLTKEEIAERIAASNAKKGPKQPHIDNTDLVAEFRGMGGRVQHLRPNKRGRRGVTVAFISRGNRVELSTAVTHTNDGFAKKVGTKTAIEHFREGKTVFLPLKPTDKKDSRRLLTVLNALI